MTLPNLSRIAPVASLLIAAKELDRIDAKNEASIRAWRERYYEATGRWPNGDIERHKHVTGQI